VIKNAYATLNVLLREAESELSWMRNPYTKLNVAGHGSNVSTWYTLDLDINRRRRSMNPAAVVAALAAAALFGVSTLSPRRCSGSCIP